MFAYIYLYLTLFSSICAKRHVVEYDILRFQPEIICNAACEECFQISIYFYLRFSQMESRDMLLSMINSDFCQKLFVMLYVENVCKYLFIFITYFLKWCHTVSMINSDIILKSFVMLYEKNVCKYLLIFTPYFLKWCHATCC